jgi:hypothetical protein
MEKEGKESAEEESPKKRSRGRPSQGGKNSAAYFAEMGETYKQNLILRFLGKVSKLVDVDQQGRRFVHRKGCYFWVDALNGEGYGQLRAKYDDIHGKRVETSFKSSHIGLLSIATAIPQGFEASHGCQRSPCARVADGPHIWVEPREINEMRKPCNKLDECPNCLRLFLVNPCNGHEFNDVRYPPCIRGTFPDYLAPCDDDKQTRLTFEHTPTVADLPAITRAQEQLRVVIQKSQARLEELQALEAALTDSIMTIEDD